MNERSAPGEEVEVMNMNNIPDMKDHRQNRKALNLSQNRELKCINNESLQAVVHVSNRKAGRKSDA